MYRSHWKSNADRQPEEDCAHLQMKHMQKRLCRTSFKVETKRKPISIDSCGLNVAKIMEASPEAIMAARKFGLDLDSHLSKGWECCDLENADLILPMEFWQYFIAGQFVSVAYYPFLWIHFAFVTAVYTFISDEKNLGNS